uniref:Ras family protein n=1 Tax=Megaviridae environmental sample TaxID=1737588 RepID=A0A5J6VH99_9VIRU|nr:MAG: Ras family protein [Megaviridae environmental sample]
MPKITIIGNTYVGKTSLVDMFCNNRMAIAPTIGAAFQSIKHNGRKLEIWDTAGMERYQALAPMYVRNANIIVFVFDITSHKSYNGLFNTWIPFIESYISKKTRYIFVGNKIDKHINIQHHPIYTEIRERLAITSIGGLSLIDAPVIWTSAINNTNVLDLFDTIVEMCPRTLDPKEEIINVETTYDLSDQGKHPLSIFRCFPW